MQLLLHTHISLLSNKICNLLQIDKYANSNGNKTPTLGTEIDKKELT